MDKVANLEDCFPLGFKAPIDYKGTWVLNKETNSIERRAHSHRDTIGDMRVEFYTMKDNTSNRGEDSSKLLISMIGK